MAFASRLSNLKDEQLLTHLATAHSLQFPTHCLNDADLEQYVSNSATMLNSHDSFVLLSLIHGCFACMGEARLKYVVQAPAARTKLDMPTSSFTILLATTGQGKSAAYSSIFDKPLSALAPLCSSCMKQNICSVQGIEDALIGSKQKGKNDSVTLCSEELNSSFSQLQKITKSSSSSTWSELNSIWSGESLRKRFKTTGQIDIPASTLHLYGYIQPRPFLQALPDISRSSGFLERTFVLFPKILLPTRRQRDQAEDVISASYTACSLEDCFRSIYNYYHQADNRTPTIEFSAEAYDSLADQQEVYNAILNENTIADRPNTMYVRAFEICAKLAAGIQVAKMVVSNLKHGTIRDWSVVVQKDTVLSAVDLFEQSEQTKNALMTACQAIAVDVRLNKTRETDDTPPQLLVHRAVARIPGRIVNARVVTHHAPAKVRHFNCDDIEGYLQTCSLLTALPQYRSNASRQVFQKIPPEDVPDGVLEVLGVEGEAYELCYSKQNSRVAPTVPVVYAPRYGEILEDIQQRLDEIQAQHENDIANM